MTTPAIEILKRSGCPFVLHTYAPRGKGARRAASALDVDPSRVLKTLVFAADDGSFLLTVIGGDGRVSEKRLARASGHRRVTAAAPRDAERLTGYEVGGISPLAGKRPLPVFLDRAAVGHDRVIVSAGARGTMIELAPRDLASLTGARLADLRPD